MPTRSIVTVIALALVALVGCSDDDGTTTDAETTLPPAAISIDDWTAEFNRLCVETTEQLAESDLTDEQFAEISNSALAKMRAIGEPATEADAALTLLDVIETQSNDFELSDAETADLDARFLEAARALGVSDECIGGAPG
jgi:hypothetical protein